MNTLKGSRDAGPPRYPRSSEPTSRVHLTAAQRLLLRELSLPSGRSRTSQDARVSFRRRVRVRPSCSRTVVLCTTRLSEPGRHEPRARRMRTARDWRETRAKGVRETVQGHAREGRIRTRAVSACAASTRPPYPRPNGIVLLRRVVLFSTALVAVCYRTGGAEVTSLRVSHERNRRRLLECSLCVRIVRIVDF